jgi:hypothetical protein
MNTDRVSETPLTGLPQHDRPNALAGELEKMGTKPTPISPATGTRFLTAPPIRPADHGVADSNESAEHTRCSPGSGLTGTHSPPLDAPRLESPNRLSPDTLDEKARGSGAAAWWASSPTHDPYPGNKTVKVIKNKKITT